MTFWQIIATTAAFLALWGLASGWTRDRRRPGWYRPPLRDVGPAFTAERDGS